MKKYIFALLASVCFLTANAQSHTWLVYGNATVKADSLGATVWTLSPGVGYQFDNHWTVGINLSWNQTPIGYDDSGHHNVRNNYSGGPFVRYTHNISNVFYCFTQLDLSYMGSYRTPGAHPADQKVTGFGAFVTPALGVNLGHGCALNFALGGLGYSSMTPDGGTAVNNFSLKFGQAYTIGFSKNFGGHMHHGGMEPGSELHKMDSDNDDK